MLKRVMIFRNQCAQPLRARVDRAFMTSARPLTAGPPHRLLDSNEMDRAST